MEESTEESTIIYFSTIPGGDRRIELSTVLSIFRK